MSKSIYDLKRQIIEKLPFADDRVVVNQFSELNLNKRYVAWLNDPEVVEFSEQRFALHSLRSCREYLQSFENSPNLFLALSTASEPALHFGNMTINLDINNGVGELGILIGERSMWGQGYGFSAWNLVCRALLDCGLRKISAGTVEPNIAMLKIMERTGMVADGRRRGHRLFDNEPVDVIHNALFLDSH